jgi:hypothetical protein
MDQILQLEKLILESRKNINSLTQLREVRLLLPLAWARDRRILFIPLSIRSLKRIKKMKLN